ncbi:MAG TPA: transketolase [Gammaproteobacteria bacterium]|nr:transketolase [Gammaproteobacteria bacterium]
MASAVDTTAVDLSADLRRRTIDTIRVLAMDAVQRANAGHPGTAMALAPVAYTLYRNVMCVNPANPRWPGRDRFVLSAGHACILQYVLLHLSGYNLSLDELKRFRQWESLTPGHPEHFLTPGIETTTGPLGQGFANAVGMTMAERVLAQRYNRPGHEMVDHRVYVIASDGDLMEGVSQEAASLAGAFGLGKLTVVYDDNHITIDGTTALSWDHEDKPKRLEAQGWHVQRLDDVNDVGALEAALEAARRETIRPSLIQVRSHIAYPAPHAQDTAKAHGAPLGEDEVRATKQILGFDPDAHFVVADEVREHMSLIDKGQRLEDKWLAKLSAWRSTFPDLGEDWDRVHTGKLAPGWIEALPYFDPAEKPKLATRAAGGKVMKAFQGFAPTMVGGAADLVESTKTAFEGAGMFAKTYAGRNVPFGVREHAMGAIVNGLAVHGGIVKPYGSTFLIFSDYMRPALRLSALMNLPVVWVYTHDSIGLGEDGPTHQPVEHYMALRAIPNLWVIRPADANETAVAWKVALEREEGPVALLLTRQAVPVLKRRRAAGAGEQRGRGPAEGGEAGLAGPNDGASSTVVADARGAERGAYVLWDSRDAGAAGGEVNRLLDVLLLATGSEVWVALEAATMLAADGKAVRVVSMPCWELFGAQPREYRDSVLPPACRTRLAVEAGVGLGWARWTGDGGDVISVERFGASAPGTTVLEKFGFTPDNVAARARSLLERRERSA